MRVWLAIRVFLSVLFSGDAARAVQEALGGQGVGGQGVGGQGVGGQGVARPEVPPPTAQRVPAMETVVDRPGRRSDAISLLAALQREARLIDMVKEPLGNYSDAQVGAAARDVLRDCGRVLDRLFDLRPLVDQEEGSQVEIPAGYDTGRYRLTGNAGGAPPFRGQLVHHGWVAARCELPTWSGSRVSEMIVAPEEVAVE